jgi:bla regulator protein BlaR1
MHVLIGIALKSLLIAGITLGLLALMKQRSAAERSWVAHIGLLALVIMAFAPLVLPSWTIEAPALFGQEPSAQASVQSPVPVPTNVSAPITANRLSDVKTASPSIISPTAVATAAYAIPAAILLFITLLALGRLIALRARADVLVDGHWLSALARAQRRMGFKHGTALLTSNELSSPISWGLMRPVILLNNRAVEASDEAEAIIAHELAHVARMDWAKLLLARIATALFWFNPLVWVLAREAHQLREEAADDAVLAADIVDTDYAKLLVGVARHECPGLLLGAHGVAPSKSSLARRVARVLDGTLVRGPAARPFALGVFVGAMLIAAPLAALTLTPANETKKDVPQAARATAPNTDNGRPYYSGTDVPTDLASIIADGVATSVTTAVAAVAPEHAASGREIREDAVADALASAAEARHLALAEANRATAQARSRAQALSNGQIDRVIEMKAAGVTADYVNAMRAASPRLRTLEPAEFAGLKAVGVTPDYARDLGAAGLHNLDADDLAAARAVGLTGDYARALASAGVRPDLDDYIQVRTTGVPVQYLMSIRRSGHQVRDADKLIELWAVNVNPGDLRLAPTPPRAPKRPPPGWDPFADPDPDGG